MFSSPMQKRHRFHAIIHHAEIHKKVAFLQRLLGQLHVARIILDEQDFNRL